MVARAQGWREHIPSGWYDIYDRLIDDLDALAIDELEVRQAKEKFGSLRVYLHPHDSRAADLTNDAAIESLKTCEKCGARGRLTVNPYGYYRTLCAEHTPADTKVFGQNSQASD